MATYYIATTGNDTTGNGSESTPWATLAKFLASSASGDTCIVAAGTYTWATATITNRTVRAATGATVIFDGANGNVHWTLNETSLVQDIILQNAALSGSPYGAIKFGSTVTYNLTVRRCTFRDLRIYGNVLAVNTNGVGLVESCLIYDVQQVALASIFELISSTGTVTIRNNIVHHDEVASSTMSAIVQLLSSSGTYTFQNNIIDFANSKPFALNSTTGTLTVSHSCHRNITGVPSGTGNITSDPLFVDAAGGNFNLRPTSPCLGNGTLV